VSLLAARRVLRTTCLTTNFDKLLELAFAKQGEVECQAIRTPEEAAYWGGEPDKCYILKLHGDYDTHSILNTRDETRRWRSTTSWYRSPRIFFRIVD
jgi:hypothetical protein